MIGWLENWMNEQVYFCYVSHCGPKKSAIFFSPELYRGMTIRIPFDLIHVSFISLGMSKQGFTVRTRIAAKNEIQSQKKFWGTMGLLENWPSLYRKLTLKWAARIKKANAREWWSKHVHVKPSQGWNDSFDEVKDENLSSCSCPWEVKMVFGSWNHLRKRSTRERVYKVEKKRVLTARVV